MRVPVITGIGVISSVGTGREAYWDALSQGKCGIGEISLFDTSGYKGRLGAEIRGFSPDDYFDRSESRRLSRCDMIGSVALSEALDDSGFPGEAPRGPRLAVVIGSGSGGLLNGEIFKRAVYSGKRGRPSLLLHFSSSSFTDHVAWRSGAQGIRMTISTACSSSSTAIGIAGELIRKDLADAVITGGSESLAETTFSGFNSLRAVDDLPCRPFDRNRRGISLGEGAAIFVVEEAGRARARGARRYAEIAGYGLSADAYHVTAPEPGGRGIASAITCALRNSGVGAGEVGYINAHGTGTQANDLAETKAFKAVFGPRVSDIPVSSTKSMVGHCLGAAGAKEAAAAIMAFSRGILPPTVHYETPDPECDLDYVPAARRKAGIEVIISTSVAFGGNNTALILRRAE